MIVLYYFEFNFSYLFYAALPLRFHLSYGKSVKYRFIEFFVFDCGSFPDLLFVFWSGVTFPLVALDKNVLSLKFMIP